MKRSRTALLLLCLLLMGSAVWWHQLGLRVGNSPSAAHKSPLSYPTAEAEPPLRTASPSSAAPVIPATKAPYLPPQKTAAVPSSMPAAANSSSTPAGDDQTGPRYKRAYMLSLDKGALSLVDAQDIEGDFAPRRGKEEAWSNMLRFRLMSASNKVLAEELLPAPDHVCRVFDPRATDGKAVTLAGTEPAIFQVRLPRVKGASRLDIFRILQPDEPATETLVGSLPLPHS